MNMLTIVNDQLSFEFPDVHVEAKLKISFQRTLRIPDDGKQYPLPPGLGSFPLRQVDDYQNRIPAKWKEHGGIMLPMFQSEALWLNFNANSVDRRGSYPFAIKVAAGKVSAVTGDEWSNGLKAKDYVVAPKQRWLDGYVVENGLIRQFVAAPLGSGFSVEEQLTGKPEFGGIQIEVFPMKWGVFKEKFPKFREEKTRGGIVRSKSLSAMPASFNYCCEMSFSDDDSLDMGLAAGGLMKQQIFEDPYQMSDWDTEHGVRCFVHLANSMLWRDITQTDPPHAPLTAQNYASQGYPWYDYYEDAPSVSGTAKLQGIKSLKEIADQKGITSVMLPNNGSISVPNEKVSNLGPDKRPGIRNGTW